MATLWVREYRHLGKFGMQVAQEPALRSYRVSFGAPALSPAFHPDCRLIRLRADEDCFLNFGIDPEVTVDGCPLGAFEVEYFGVESTGHSLVVWDGVTFTS